MRSFLIRSLVAIVAIPALLYLFYLGGVALRLFIAVLIVVGMVEAWRLSGQAGASFHVIPAVLTALAVPWLSHLYLPGVSWPVWLGVVIIVPAFSVFRTSQVARAAAIFVAQVVMTIWIGVGFGTLLGLRELFGGDGFKWLVVLFANLWIGDTAAYLFGVWLGKAKLSPIVSPNKTIAGAVAQVITSGVIGIVLVMSGWIEASAALIIAASLLIAVVGQLGDLIESIPKRLAGQKDSSAIIPGHGGVLDRFDSALFAAPGLYALLSIWPR